MTYISKIASRTPLRTAFLVLVLLVVPLSAGARMNALVSFFSTPAQAQTDTIVTETVQNLPLLQATLNSDPKAAIGGGDITIVEDTALLPESGPSGTLADIEEKRPGSGHISVYVVREGDTLSQIASMFNVTANTIVWANDISRGDHIEPGSTLIILPISGVQHTVEKGDTLKSIVKKYGGDLDEILAYNDLSEGASLTVGDSITIPDGEIAKSKSAPTSSGSTGVVRGGGPSYDGYYIHPVPGAVRSQGVHGYNAVDLAAPVGTTIRAAASGQVIISKNYGWNGGYGNYLVIKHDNGTQTLYSHNSTNLVSVGQYVVQGQEIARVGVTGKTTGAHVHFEVRGARNPF